MFDNNLRIYENLNKIEASLYLVHVHVALLILFCQICTVCNQGLGQFHIHVNFVIGRDILTQWLSTDDDVVMQTRNRIFIMIEMLTQNPDVAKPKHRLVQSMPFSMVDPRSTKPNKHFPLIFGRLWTSMCTWLQSNPEILWSFVCLQRIQYVQTGSLFLLLQSQRCAMQSTSLNIICNCCTSFTVVYTTGNAYTWPLTFLLFFAHFSVNIWYPDFVFEENLPKRIIYHSTNDIFMSFRAVCTFKYRIPRGWNKWWMVLFWAGPRVHTQQAETQTRTRPHAIVSIVTGWCTLLWGWSQSADVWYQDKSVDNDCWTVLCIRDRSMARSFSALWSQQYS